MSTLEPAPPETLSQKYMDLMIKLGLGSRTSRFLTGALLVGGLSYGLKFPGSFFRAHSDDLKPWVPLADPDDDEATWIHWALLPLLGGLLFSEVL